MGYFQLVSFLAGYHLVLILFSLIGIIRFPRSKPWRWFAGGLLIQLIADFHYSGDLPFFFLFVYLVLLSLLLGGIIRLQVSSSRT